MYMFKLIEQRCVNTLVPSAMRTYAAGDTPMPSRLTGQEINRNGLNGVHKSAFEPVTSAQNKRRKLTPHNSSESENNSQPHTHENIAEHEDEKV